MGRKSAQRMRTKQTRKLSAQSITSYMKTKHSVKHQSANVGGINVFYREAGDPANPAIVLLHGFPSSSHMFQGLIEELKDEFYLIAPDYPGFGFSDAPNIAQFEYTFDNLSKVVTELLETKGVLHYWLYLQDYGGPIGFRIAAQNPERVAGLLIQNANAYMEGVSELLAGAAMPFWKNRNHDTEQPLRGLVTVEGVKMQYLTGVSDSSRVSPDTWTHDLVALGRPGNLDVQLELLFNYQSNVPKFPQWQEYFRANQPKTLITWGKNDPFFTEAGARAYLQDIPEAELHLLDTGHFALEDQGSEIARLVQEFINRKVK
jgi:pimeloyl-ACP methyl ester carboxylesterase